jgi:hypothetical protein
MAWVETTNGYVNLATAQSAHSENDRWVIYDGGGDRHTLQHVYTGGQFLDDTRDTVVPASGLDRLHLVCAGDGQDPEIFVEVYPIIGWRLCGNHATPIIPGVNDIEGYGTRGFIERRGGDQSEDAQCAIRKIEFVLSWVDAWPP